MIQRIPPAALAFVTFLLALGITGCGRGGATGAPPAAPIPTIAQQPDFEPAGPVSVPQSDVTLPPPQPVPSEALPRVAGPLPTDREPVEAPTETASSTVGQTATRSPAELPAGPDETAPMPRLGVIVTDEDRQAHDEAIDLNLARATESLRVIRNGRMELNPDERAAVKRIQAFVSQVEVTRQDDPASAQNLAERARLLAEDLVRNLR